MYLQNHGMSNKVILTDWRGKHHIVINNPMRLVAPAEPTEIPHNQAGQVRFTAPARSPFALFPRFLIHVLVVEMDVFFDGPAVETCAAGHFFIRTKPLMQQLAVTGQ